MSTEENKAIARRFIQVWADGNLANIEELVAPNFSLYYPYLKKPVQGPEALKQALMEFHTDMSDTALVSEDDIIAEGDKVVVCWTARGTSTDKLEQRLGIPSLTGKQVVWTGITIFRIVDGKIVEERGLEDDQAHMRQLGLVPRRRAPEA